MSTKKTASSLVELGRYNDELVEQIIGLRRDLEMTRSQNAEGRAELTRLSASLREAGKVISEVMATNKVLTVAVAEYQQREAERRQAVKTPVSFNA